MSRLDSIGHHRVIKAHCRLLLSQWPAYAPADVHRPVDRTPVQSAASRPKDEVITETLPLQLKGVGEAALTWIKEHRSCPTDAPDPRVRTQLSHQVTAAAMKAPARKFLASLS